MSGRNHLIWGEDRRGWKIWRERKKKRQITVSNTGRKRNRIKYSLSFSRQTKGATGIDWNIFSPKVKKIVYPKMKNCLLTLKSIQTCMTFFLPWNIKEDILKNVATFLGNSMKVNGVQNNMTPLIFAVCKKNICQNIIFIFHRRKKVKQVWNNNSFCLNYAF